MINQGMEKHWEMGTNTLKEVKKGLKVMVAKEGWKFYGQQ